jgi:hypothetical protein
MPSVSIPVETSRPVLGHLTIKVVMRTVTQEHNTLERAVTFAGAT